MSAIPPEPTKAEIDQLRAAAIQKIEAGGPFDPQDVRRIRSDDKYMRRFLMHHDNDQKLSLEMVMDTLKWRHENQCNGEEEKGEWITVFFDMCDTGMKNMDMEFIQYMINLFKSYYPWVLNYIIVFEMPWLLNGKPTLYSAMINFPPTSIHNWCE
ncbi:Motile sperm domain-containing protein 2 [Portunus trituberculatus]|uniref:Motile sperm domain-containing protein 2 n=1 Tax=Portunus trituberculatus TaxID=210409 RepID=A0A5B7D2L8_PORTR|nr:Motile sperm domain-containing protein 2 [Portunus trituberculatus]